MGGLQTAVDTFLMTLIWRSRRVFSPSRPKFSDAMKLRSLGNLQPKMVIAMNEICSLNAIEFALLCVQAKVALLKKIQRQT